ncbi:MAG: FMN-binding protein, partial [Planctomycetota bacterium]|nr:FMN-binding protein [Planctomycetota bacterium]
NETSKQIPLNILESPTPATNVFMRGAGYFVRLALLAGLVLVIRSEHRWQQAQLAGTGPERVMPEDVRTFLPQATTLGTVSPSNASRSVLGPDGQTLGWFVQTAPKSDSVIGYSGTTNCLLVFDHDNRLAGVQILDSGDTADHVRDVQNSPWFLSQWHDQTWKTAPSLEVDSVSGATLTSLAIVDSIRTRLGDPQPNLRFPDPPDMDRIQSFFPTADRIEAKQTSGVFDVLDGRGNRLGQLRGTSPTADSVVGYQGPTETVLAIDITGKVIGLWIQQSYDNQPYVDYVDEDTYFKEKFQGQTLVELASQVESIEEIEGVSGATMTSQAVAEAIAVTATIPTKETPSHGIRWHASSRDLGTCLVL